MNVLLGACFSLLVIGCPFFTAAEYGSIDYSELLNKSSLPYADPCDPGPEIYCSGCRKLVVCINVQGTGQEVDVSKCPSNQICVDGACIVPKTNPPCSPIEGGVFECTTAGTYPDPADCKQYYMCTPDAAGTPQASRLKCEGPPNEYGYNARTYSCDKKLTTKQCPSFPVPLCNSRETVALTENPNIYYRCTPDDATGEIMYPQMDRCPNGKRYSASGKCT